VLAQHKLLAVVGGLFAASLISEAVLGWALGVTDAWLPVFVVAALLAVLISADARLGARRTDADSWEESYDKAVCAIVVIAVVGAVACLYLPMPWGGLAAGAVVVGLLVALRLRQE
jgi:hypothetical protein